ncbi:VWA domain-containing protein [Candidatus Chloroploca sp. M-50]|uniref:VWA domain-containing protein n=2 Tax=Candidatus Chloroploca mongolica TaxID=2528176 RepID=A0ABS4D9C9_9CHLR|nr:VWA domain-containing protein [Candidatus Chloroploca mongolica]
MITLSFIYPAALLLLGLLPLLWLFAWATRAPNLARLGRRRFGALLVLRSLMLLALVLALAGTQLVRPSEQTAVVFLLDGSDSFAPALREEALAYVNQAMEAGEPTDRAAMVVFGADPAVERAAVPVAPLNRVTSVVTPSRTNIAEAIQLGLALLPADAQKRLVLLSDGVENTGRAVEAARIAALRGVPIEVVPFVATSGPDLLVTALDVPATAREGQSLPLTVRFQSNVATTARVELLADGELVAVEEALPVAVGAGSLQFNLPVGEAGFRRFEVRMTSPVDTQALNNRATAFTEVEGPPRVLIVASAEDRAAPLRAALEAGEVRVEVRAPAQVPAQVAQLRQFAAVFLVDVPAPALASEVQRALATYVREQGGGLAMIGGTEAFGAGGWRRTPLAEILPVDLNPRSQEERPDLALVLVLDRSGSMEDTAGPGRNRLDLAKDAVVLATQGLAEQDQLGIVVFDDVAQTVLPLQPFSDLLIVEEALGRISTGGGTNIRAGVALGADALADVDARVKHLILLTDGLDSSNYADLIDRMRADGATITIVSIGGDANPSLEGLAERGGGAFYRVLQAQDVPAIFLNETIRVAGRDIVEERFLPAVVLNAPPIRGLGPLPPLNGYNATAARPAARTLLVAPDGEPLLAVWQVGLGRVLAWTSDLKAQWATDWLAWEGFAPFATGLVDAVLPPVSSGRMSLEARAEGSEILLDLFVFGEDGRMALTGEVTGRLLDPAERGAPVAFRQVGPGRFRAVVPAPDPGVYLAQVRAFDQQGEVFATTSAGVAVSYSPEYAPSIDGQVLLNDLAAVTGGRVAPPPASLFEPAGQRVGRVNEIGLPLLWLALVLLPFDIALRRLFLRQIELPAFFKRRRRSTSSGAEVGLDPALIRLRTARTQHPTPTASSHDVADPPRSTAPARPDPREQTAPPPSRPTRNAPAPDDETLAALLAARQRRK